MSLNVINASCLQDGATVGEVPVLLRATLLELFACEALRRTHLEFHLSKRSALHCALNRNRNTLVTFHHHPVTTVLSITQSQPGSQSPSHNRALNHPVTTVLSITQSQPCSQSPSHNRALNHPVTTVLSITQSQPGSQSPSHNRALFKPNPP